MTDMGELETMGDNAEEVVERLLSERLVEGFLLLEKACPACATPLVKRNSLSPRATFDHGTQEHDNFTYGAGVDSVAYESPIQPLLGVPFCVSCQAHVVTTADEVLLLEAADHLKVRGTIMVAMSRESSEEESVMTTVAESEVVDKEGVAARSNASGSSAKENNTQTEVEQLPKRESVESSTKFDNDGGIYDRDRFSATASINRTIASTEGYSVARGNESEKLRKEASMLDDEDDISLQEIEVVHLDDATACSETERQVLQQSDSTKTTERLVVQESNEKSVAEAVGNEEGTYRSTHSQDVEPNPLRKHNRIGADSFANTSIAVLRSDTSVPILASESRANTSIAVLRGDVSFPVCSGESPTNTSLAVLRGDPSFPTRFACSNDDTSFQMKRANITMPKHMESSEVVVPRSQGVVNGIDPRRDSGTVASMNENALSKPRAASVPPTSGNSGDHDVDRHRSLITQSKETSSPDSHMQKLQSQLPVRESERTSVSSPKVQLGTQNTFQQMPLQNHQSLPIESLVSYEERRAIATRTLGKKMMQGYSLTEHKCIKCQMPLMEKDKVYYCVVCPVLRQHHMKMTTPAIHAPDAKPHATVVESPKNSRGLSENHLNPKDIVVCMSSDSPPSPGENHEVLFPVSPAMESPATTALNQNSPRRTSTPKALLTESNLPNELTQKRSANNSSAPSKANKTSTSKSSRQHVGRSITKEPLNHTKTKARLSTEHKITEEWSSATASNRWRVEAATQTSPALNIDKALDTYQSKSFPLHSLNVSNHAASHSDQSSKAPDPPSTFIAEVPDDESAKMSSITESYVTTFSLGTSRKSVHRERTLKVRPNKPALQTYMLATKVTSQHDDAKNSGSVINPQSHTSTKKQSVLAKPLGSSSGSKQETIGTKSMQEEDPCMQTLRDYSGILQAISATRQTKQTEKLTGNLRHLADDSSAIARSPKMTNTTPAAMVVPNEIEARFKQLDEERSIATSKREQSEHVIRKKTKRLQELEKARKAHETAVPDSKSGMQTDFSVVMKQQILQEELQVRREIEAAEKTRDAAQQEEKRITDERRSYEDGLRLAELENAAERQQKEAEEAMEKAKLAIDQLSAARQQVLADTIAEGEAAAVSEAESIVRSLAEDYHNKAQHPTAADIHRERWEVLRTEGRLAMTRRVMAGWKVLPELCMGTECENVPLLLDGNVKQCVICGGSGNGLDGVYALPLPDDDEEDDADPSIESSRVQPPLEIETPRLDISPSLTKPEDDVTGVEFPSPRNPEIITRNVANLQENFESKRAMVTKEIGERMMRGWNLLDASCPYCVMPLMTDLDQKNEICVLCGVVGAIIPKSTDRSVKTWTKGEVVHASRRPKDEKKNASASRMSVSMNSRQSIPNQSVVTNTASKAGDTDERKRLKRELLREIIAETTAMISKRSVKSSQESKSEAQLNVVHPARASSTEIGNMGKDSKKERLRELVIKETKRATERLKRSIDDRKEPEVMKPSIPAAQNVAEQSSKVSIPGVRGGSTVASRDPAPSHDAQPRSLILRDRDEGSRADPPATQSVSVRKKHAVEPDGTASWQEPIENLDLLKAAVKSVDDSHYEAGQVEGGLSPTNPPSVFVLEIPKGFDVNDEYSLRELIKTATQGKDKNAPKPLDIDTTLDVHQSDHRMIIPSPGMTEATIPETSSSPTHSKFTVRSDASNKATYAGKVKARATAPTPSPGISVAPEPEVDARTRRSSHSNGGSFLPPSMRPATSPGMDSIERMKPAASPGMDSIVEDAAYEDESFVGIPMSKSAPARTHPIRRRMSPERMRFNERKNRVAAVRPKYPELSRQPDDARTDGPTLGSQRRGFGAIDDRISVDATSTVATREGTIDRTASHVSQVSWGSRPRVTPESIMRPRSTRSACEEDSLADLRGGAQTNHSESDDRRLRLARGIRSDSGSTSMCTSRAISGPLNFPPPPPPSSSSLSGRGHTLLVQGEPALSPGGDDRHLLRPDPIVVVQGEPARSGDSSSSSIPSHHRRKFSPEEVVHPRAVLSSREVIVVEGGPLDPNNREDRDDWNQDRMIDGADEDDDDVVEDLSPTQRNWHRGSPTGSVGSATLDAVLARIEETKKQLQNAPTVSSYHSGGGVGDGMDYDAMGGGRRGPFEKPQKLRQLIDNLAAAAEEIEKQDRLDMSMCF